ncbi:MAG: glycosyltransferase [Eggerthellaceae bacterium]|nr:glycosyltransferase [Eggerthellaceae bacterium]
MEKLAIVIVTFKRQELLMTLFDSLVSLDDAPWRIIIADNENSPLTSFIVDEYEQIARDIWGEPELDAEGERRYFVYFPQPVNGGGAGGFSAGTQRAFDLGAEWFWLMDDDVAVEPDAIQKLSKWTDRYDVIQGRRYDYDGGPFYWQYHFLVPLGIPNPIAPEGFETSDHRVMNTVCFEGGLFARSVVEKIGIPDPRFFIYWDDTIYGYLASKVTTPVVVSDFILRRTRNINNWDIAGVRQLNSTSDMNRYHIMRNRGYMARYFAEHGDFNRFTFGFGTFLTFCKEFIRLFAVDKKCVRSGAERLFEGWKDSRVIMHDPTWKPMPPLT